VTSTATNPRGRAQRRAAIGSCASIILLLGGQGLGTAAAPSPGGAGGHVQRWTLGLKDDGTTIRVNPGARILVRLPGGASGGFHHPKTSAAQRVRRIGARGGYPSQHQAVAHFVAIGVGRARLSAINDYTCLHATPPCLPPQREWTVRVRVQPGEGASPDSIGPGQSYLGVINGKTANPTVDVVCPGPAAGDRRGPPTSSQTLAVTKSPALSGPGFTGSSAHHIVAVFADDRS
jgi:hypothetical protein